MPILTRMVVQSLLLLDLVVPAQVHPRLLSALVLHKYQVQLHSAIPPMEVGCVMNTLFPVSDRTSPTLYLHATHISPTSHM